VTTLGEIFRRYGPAYRARYGSTLSESQLQALHAIAYEVRSWTGWYRHMTLAMWAQAFLAVARAEHGVPMAPKKGLFKQAGPSSLAGFKARRGLGCG
jgi:hypothetical protein